MLLWARSPLIYALHRFGHHSVHPLIAITGSNGIHGLSAEPDLLRDRPRGPQVQQDSAKVWRLVDAAAQQPPRKEASLPLGSFAIESFLPIRLRAHQYAYRLSRKTRGAANISGLPVLLRRLRARHGTDLLASLGTDHKRWEALQFLMESMILKCGIFKSSVAQPAKTPVSLDQLTQNPIQAPPSEISSQARHQVPHLSRSQSSHTFIRHALLGEIWQTLSSLILYAEDHAEEHNTVMEFVLASLAELHHINAMPSSIYTCTPFPSSVPYPRPQTMRLLSSRIAAVLSDVAWGKHWEREMEKATLLGYELAPPRVKPQISALGTHIWLDLILWTCVEGAWISEAAWILREMQRKKGWSVISWNNVCQEKRSALSVASVLKSQLATSRINQSAGVDIAQAGNHYIDIPPRTISREVVQTVCNGVLNVCKDDLAAKRRSMPQRNEYVLVCLRLLNHDSQPGLGMALLGILEALELNSLVSRNAILSAISFMANDSKSPMDSSSALLGLLYDVLAKSSDAADYWTCVHVLRVVQNVVDTNRIIRLQEFAKKLSHPQTDTLDASAQLILYPQIPVQTVTGILDVVIENELESLGRWLVSNDEIDGGIIPEDMFYDISLQPALIAFAAATKDNQLLQQFLKYLRPPLSVPIQRALLHCQLRLQRFDAVKKILHHLRDVLRVGWEAIDATVLASVIMQPDCPGEASDMLRAMLTGLYDPARDFSKTKDMSREATTASLVRILISTPNLALHKALTGIKPGPSEGRVPVEAFNVLLKSVVNIHGMLSARALCDQWCHLHDHDDQSQVVHANLSTIRTVIRPLMLRIRDDPETIFSRRRFDRGHTFSEQMAGLTTARLSDEDRSLINWAVPRFQHLGLRLEEIRAEIQGYRSVLLDNNKSQVGIEHG